MFLRYIIDTTFFLSHLLSPFRFIFIIHFFQVMAVSRSNICKHGMDSLSRGGAAIYYASVFLYYWVFSTPIVSLVFGSYLYICINWLHIHFDEAFSSLRIANYKSFTRFHINTKGDLEVFTLAVDKVRNNCWLFVPDSPNACSNVVFCDLLPTSCTHLSHMPSEASNSPICVSILFLSFPFPLLWTLKLIFRVM